MPWVKIGRYRFDLDDVALVTDAVGEEAHEKGQAERGGVTVTLKARLAFDLLGSDAELFTQTFDEHVANRLIGRSPPGDTRGPKSAVESSAVRPRPVPAHAGNPNT